MTEYNILLKAVVNPASDVQGQLNKLAKNTTINLKAKIADPKAIENQIQRWNNALSKMQSVKPTVFASNEVRTATTSFTSLFDGFRKGTVSMDTMRTKLDDVRVAMSKVSGATQQTVKDGDSLGRTIGKDILKVAEWTVATTLLFGALKQLQEGVQYVKDLNKEMTNIGVVVGQTTDELSGMAQEFNQTAKEYGVTTLDVAQGSLEFIRQGKTVAETNELIRVSMMTSKLANMESAEATEYLTAIMAGFKLEASDMIGVLDKLVAVDNKSATSVAELSEGMKRSANSAQQVGVSIEELISYLGTVSSVSRKSAESIGK
jgi:methyl-accepting chemotaxis protein